jgi:AAA+ superfamily predicted ATPase
MIKSTDESMVVVFHNTRGLLNQMQNVQLLIDSAMAARERYSAIIMVGCRYDLPPELESVVHFFDFPLPSRQDLIELCVDKIVLPNYLSLTENPDFRFPNLETDSHPAESRAQYFRRKTIELNHNSLEGAAKAATGLNPLAAENAFALSITMSGKLDPTTIQDQKRQVIKQSETLEFFSTEETMDSVGGFGVLKDWINKRNRAYSDDALSFGVTPPKGILLVGLSGSGKSLVAKSVASSLGIPLIRFDVSKVFHHLVGSSETKMSNALRIIEAISPVTLWLDELEKSLAGSNAERSSDSGVASRVLGQFLQWRQETKAHAFVCATCNNIRAIPVEFYRPGRIDAIFYSGNPNILEREEILAIHLRKRNRDPETVDLKRLASVSEGYNGAEIELAVIEAIFTAYNLDKSNVTTQMLEEAFSGIVSQAIRNKEQMDELETWASGRAINVSHKIPEGERGRKISSFKPRKLTTVNTGGEKNETA